MGEFFSDYMSWSNFYYLVGIILAGYATAVTAKNRAIFIEIQELVETLERVNKDKKVTSEEKKEVMKEALDIAKVIIASKWAIWRSK